MTVTLLTRAYRIIDQVSEPSSSSFVLWRGNNDIAHSNNLAVTGQVSGGRRMNHNPGYRATSQADGISLGLCGSVGLMWNSVGR